MSGTCETCQSWIRYVDEECTRADGSTFTMRSQHPGWGVCTRSPSDSSEPKDKTTLMCGQDSEGYLGWVDTKPGFSCVMFEAKS